jgi:cellulose synthase/poly-beta-1,6-N-acetylglucosamine synthase-like glycosyltransferase
MVADAGDDEPTIELVAVPVGTHRAGGIYGVGTQPARSRRVPVLSGRQKAALVGGVVVVAAAWSLSPPVTAVVFNCVLILLFTVSNILKLFLVWRSLDDPCDIAVSEKTLARRGNRGLPIYTILVPLYREAAVISQLVQAIARLDYPVRRLDVMLLVEEDDDETRSALERLRLPRHFNVVTVPDVGPRGKARACNHGLALARGKYLVIFDAEDCPEPNQLRKVVAAFDHLPDDVVCLQAKLNYFNRTQNALTRLFTAEYSVWFDRFLPGLQSLDGAIPLGGTSNHFPTRSLRELGGWDVYNVTEDADLGMRIFMAGLKTAVIDSTTFEEANSRLGNWIRQRSRWVKGYMQTYLTHMRHPVRQWRVMGTRTFVIFQLFFCAGTLAPLINPVYWVLTVVWYTTHAAFIQAVFPTPVLYLGTAGLFIGNAAFTLTIMAGCMERRNFDDVKWALLSPVYWILTSVAAWKALLQLASRPYYWEKTTHGFSAFGELEPAPPTTMIVGVAAIAPAPELS